MRKVLLIFILFFLGTVTYAQNYQLHSVYIYSFIRYIQWPEADSSRNFVIGVVGESPITTHLQKMAEAKKAGVQNIIIKEFASAGEVSGCNIVFLPEKTGDQLKTLLKTVGDQSILLVTEGEGQGKRGSNINFVIRNEKLGFELNQAAMERATLKVSSELARLAIII